METDSLSCLRSLGASVPFTSLYVLFKIYLLNLDSLEFWQWFELKRKRMLFALFPFLCLHVDVLFFCYNHTYWAVQYCSLQRAFCRDRMKTLSYLRWQSKILGKPQPLFCCRFCWKKKAQMCIFVFQQERYRLPAPFYLLLSVRLIRSKVRRGSRGLQLHRVCWDCCLYAVESILHCLVLCLCWSFREISSHCK